MEHIHLAILNFDKGSINAAAARLSDLLGDWPAAASLVYGRAIQTSGHQVVLLSGWSGADEAEGWQAEVTASMERCLPAPLSIEQRSGEQSLRHMGLAVPAYERITILKVKSGRADDVIRTTQPTIPPIFAARPGYVECHLAKTGEDSGVFATGWETKQQSEAEVFGGFASLKQLGPAMLSIGKILPAFVSFDTYAGKVLFAESRVA